MCGKLLAVQQAVDDGAIHPIIHPEHCSPRTVSAETWSTILGCCSRNEHQHHLGLACCPRLRHGHVDHARVPELLPVVVPLARSDHLSAALTTLARRQWPPLSWLRRDGAPQPPRGAEPRAG